MFGTLQLMNWWIFAADCWQVERSQKTQLIWSESRSHVLMRWIAFLKWRLQTGSGSGQRMKWQNMWVCMATKIQSHVVKRKYEARCTWETEATLKSHPAHKDLYSKHKENRKEMIKMEKSKQSTGASTRGNSTERKRKRQRNRERV